ncbi:MAG: hypothetical protein V7731_21125 [Amphritea sp.]
MCELRSLKIECCTQEAQQLIDQLESAEKSVLVKQTLESLFDLPEFRNELFTVQGDGHSADAGKLFVLLDPTDLFRRLVTAVVAGDIKALLIEHKRHLSCCIGSD